MHSATVGSNKPKEATDRRVSSSNHTAFEVKTKKKKRANEAKHSEANVTWNKTDYYSGGGGAL